MINQKIWATRKQNHHKYFSVQTLYEARQLYLCKPSHITLQLWARYFRTKYSQPSAAERLEQRFLSWTCLNATTMERAPGSTQAMVAEAAAAVLGRNNV